MSHEIKTEPKTELSHHDNTPPNDDGHDHGKTPKMAELLAQKDRVRDGDLGSQWLAEYTGPRPELTDEMNNQIRNKIDMHLMPMYVVLVSVRMSESDG